MKHLTLLAYSSLALAAFGCGQEATTGPPAPPAAAIDESSVRLPFSSAHDLGLMSRNIYVGADLDAVIAALVSQDPSDDIPALVQAAATLQETDFTVRAEGFAREIDRTRPDVVGIVEVSKIDVDLDLTPFGGPHLVVHENFLPEILSALKRHHLNYRVAASNLNFAVEPTPGVRLEDYDVTLVGPGVQVKEGVLAQNFTFNVGEVAPNVVISYGFTLVPVKVRGRHYAVATTHLQPNISGLDLAQLRVAQMLELIRLMPTDVPAVIQGDLNDHDDSPMYQAAADSGFADVWAVLRPNQAGLTCCHSIQLTNSQPLTERIDFILARGFEHRSDPVTGFIVRVGLFPWELLPGPLHPIFVSDHAGLVARLNGPGH
jgi:endonuclease/exonuclease/phosphatase family protein